MRVVLSPTSTPPNFPPQPSLHPLLLQLLVLPLLTLSPPLVRITCQYRSPAAFALAEPEFEAGFVTRIVCRVEVSS